MWKWKMNVKMFSWKIEFRELLALWICDDGRNEIRTWEEKGQYYEGSHAYTSTPWKWYEFGSNFNNSYYKIVTKHF